MNIFKGLFAKKAPQTAKAVYGHLKDSPDSRDYQFSSKAKVASVIPSKVDLTQSLPPCYDQGQLGSCTGNAIAAALEFNEYKDTKKFVTPSRLFIYYGEKSRRNRSKR